MSYLVAADWLIDTAIGRPQAQHLLERLSDDGLTVSIIAVAKIYEGAFGTLLKSLSDISSFSYLSLFSSISHLSHVSSISTISHVSYASHFSDSRTAFSGGAAIPR